jgi:hypothetical protein
MKKNRFHAAVGALFVGVFIIMSCQTSDKASKDKVAVQEFDYKSAAEQFVNDLAAEKYAEAGKTFDDAMKSAMPEAVLKETWEAIIAQVGKFVKIIDIELQPSEEYIIVLTKCEFKSMNVMAQVAFTVNGNISGLWFGEA